ncbi:MAG: LemA family protein [candidate division KSB1 bacterium]|nr:LemA family protein [candidate division KSB1 bacterium]MDZ7341311.1 LemA family protein [candidate division KSB1 bacterium]
MNKGCIVALVVVAVLVVLVLLLALPIIGSYNTLVKMREDVNTSWAQVQNVLQRRYDLIPNLVETVKGYAAHEREVLTEVTRARASVGSARTPDEAMKANNDLSNALARLLVVVEQYPNLKANENFIRLQDELAGTENRIAVERRRYNDTVRVYNQKIQSFPTVLFAGMLGFEKRNYFEAPAAAQEAPKVDFSKPSGN